MKNNIAKKNKLKTMSAILIVLIVLMLFMFSACDKDFSIDESKTFFVYLVETSVDSETSIANIQIAFTSDENTLNILPGVEVVCNKYRKQQFWFTYVEYLYHINGEELNVAIENFLPYSTNEELKNVDSEDLIVSYQYATIYKSTTTNTSVEKQGQNYVHIWQFDMNDDIDVQIDIRSENRASWYGTLIVVALAAIAVLTPLTIALSKKRKDKTTKEEKI